MIKDQEQLMKTRQPFEIQTGNEEQMGEVHAPGQMQQTENTYESAYFQEMMNPAMQMDASRYELLGVKYGDSREMTAVKDALREVNTKMLSSQIAKDREEFETQKAQFRDMFIRLEDMCRQYLNSHKNPWTRSGKERKRLVAGTMSLAVSQRSVILDGAADKLYRNLGKHPELEGITWANVIGIARQTTYDLDSGGLELQKSGAATSDVYVMQKKDPEHAGEDNPHKKKFFKKHEENLSAEEEMERRYGEASDLADQMSPERRMIGERLLAYHRKYMADDNQAEFGLFTELTFVPAEAEPEEFVERAREHAERYPTAFQDGNPLEEILSNREQWPLFKEVAREVARYSGRQGSCEAAMIRPGALISTRNVATSRMAALFGAPMMEMIPQSTTAEIIENGKASSGIVMRQAKGMSVADIALKAREENKSLVYSPQAARQLQWLQLFDFVCGQTDRHTGNRFGEFTDENNIITITSIQGIDNDMSFGLLRGERQMFRRQNGNLPTLEMGGQDMPVMDKELMEKIDILVDQRDVIEHTFADLLNGDEISALLERLQLLKTYLDNYRTRYPNRVLEREQWNDAAVSALGAYADGRESSYFFDMQSASELRQRADGQNQP